MRLFVYGTLLDPARLACRVGRGLPLHPATLPGWRRVSLRGTPYPTLRRAFRARVAGALIDVDAAALRRLTADEGDRYLLRRVAVRAGGRETVAFAWIAPAVTARPWP